MSDEPKQQNLSEVLQNTPDGSAPNLNIHDTLDLVGPHQRQQVLEQFCRKVKYNGYLDIEGVDVMDVCRAYYQGYLTTDEFNKYLYNDGTKANYTGSVSTVEEMCEQLQKFNFQIIHKRRNKYVYYIRALRVAEITNFN